MVERLLNTDVRYSNLLTAHYGMISPEIATKWSVIEPSRGEFDFTLMDQVVSYAGQHHLQVQGIPLVWWLANPAWLTQGNFTRAEFITILEDHIRTVVSRYAGRVAIWNVANETVDALGNLHDNVFLRGIGADYLDIAYRAARAADPTAKLYYNDIGGEVPSGKQVGALRLIFGFRARGVPIDGIGLQMHTTIEKAAKGTLTLGATDTRPTPKQFAETLLRYRNLGLEVAITEMDVRVPFPVTTSKLRRQAAIYKQVYKVCVQAPNCASLTTWGFTDRNSWVEGWTNGKAGAALPFDKNFAPKPAAFALFGGM